MPKAEVHIIAVQSYGYIDGPDDQGSGAQGSRARIQRGLELARELTKRGCRVRFFFPQGYGATDPQNPRPGGRTESLGDSLARYVKGRLVDEGRDLLVVSEPLSWGTFNDVPAIPFMVKEIGEPEIPHVHFVTDPVHLKRVRLVWNHTKPKGWQASFHPARDHRMTWKERWVREPIARMRYRWRFLCGG